MNKQQTKNTCKSVMKSGVMRMACAHTQLSAEFIAALDAILNGKCRTNAEVCDILYEHLGEFFGSESDDESAEERDLAAELAGKALFKYRKNNDVEVCIETLEAIAAFCPDITGIQTHCNDCEHPLGEHKFCIMCIADNSISGSEPEESEYEPEQTQLELKGDLNAESN